MPEYYVNAHGDERKPFILPPNIRVIMLCKQTDFDACPQNELRLWRIVMGGIGDNLSNFIEKYNQYKSPSESDSTELCIYTPNYNMDYVHKLGLIESPELVQELFDGGKCPNLLLS